MRELLNDCFVLEGDCLERLKELPEKSIHTCVTSPPYYALRDYGTGSWEGGDPDCEHEGVVLGNNRNFVDREGRGSNNSALDSGDCTKCGAIKVDSQIGLEKTPEEFIQNLVHVFREVRRVLRDDGTLWLNMGDSYWGGKGASGQGDSAYQEARVAEGKSFNKGHHQIGGSKQTRPTDDSHETFKPKDLMMIPHRLAIALQDDGWWVRQDIVWHKPNPMPESVKDRCTKAHEYIFLLSKSKHYHYDHEAVKERTTDSYGGKRGKVVKRIKTQSMMKDRVFDTPYSHEMRRNRHSVWTVNVLPYSEAHFAVYPPDLIEPCILAGCPPKVCSSCLTPYKREFKTEERFLSLEELNESNLNPDSVIPNYEIVDGERVSKLTRIIEDRNLPDHEELRQYLQENRKKAGLTIKEVEDFFGTWQAHHWLTKGGSYPPAENWMDLKQLLDLDDTYDKAMTEIFIRSGIKVKSETIDLGLVKQCECECELSVSGTVLDPFGGSGTTAGVALKHGRKAIVCELNPEYVDLMPKRIEMISGRSKEQRTLFDW
jgi:DNA modification methylase